MFSSARTYYSLVRLEDLFLKMYNYILTINIYDLSIIFIYSFLFSELQENLIRSHSAGKVNVTYLLALPTQIQIGITTLPFNIVA